MESLRYSDERDGEEKPMTVICVEVILMLMVMRRDANKVVTVMCYGGDCG